MVCCPWHAPLLETRITASAEEIDAFVREHCDEFADMTDEQQDGLDNSHEYWSLYKQFVSLFERKISEFVAKEGISEDDFHDMAIQVRSAGFVAHVGDPGPCSASARCAMACEVQSARVRPGSATCRSRVALNAPRLADPDTCGQVELCGHLPEPLGRIQRVWIVYGHDAGGGQG